MEGRHSLQTESKNLNVIFPGNDNISRGNHFREIIVRKAYLGHCQTLMMELFGKVADGYKTVV